MAGDEHLCAMLSDIRTSRKLSIRKMAEICNISRESIRKYESGKMIPSNQATMKILDGLGVDKAQSRQVQLYIYQARRLRSGGDDKSHGAAAQAELERLFSGQDQVEAKADRLVELFLKEVDPARRTDSFEFFLKDRVVQILRG